MAAAMSERNTQRRPGRPGRLPGSGRPLVATTIRIDPEVYRQMILAADRAGLSLNRWIESACQAEAERSRPPS